MSTPAKKRKAATTASPTSEDDERLLAIELMPIQDDHVTPLLELLWQRNGTEAIERLDRAIAIIDRRLKREVPSEKPALSPVALLIARHDLVPRRDWLVAKSKGADPEPLTPVEPTQESLLSHLAAARAGAAG